MVEIYLNHMNGGFTINQRIGCFESGIQIATGKNKKAWI